MTEQHDESLEQRIERLERVVADLQRALSRANDAAGQRDRAVAEPRQDTSAPATRPAQSVSGVSQGPASQPPFPAVRSKPTKKSSKLPDVMRESEYWLNKIGIGLLLLEWRSSSSTPLTRDGLPLPYGWDSGWRLASFFSL